MNHADNASRDELALDRTDLAEDRTLLANERTFGGWLRTALAAVGIGVGFNALFRTMQPVWVPKAIATVFILLGIVVAFMAWRRAVSVAKRLEWHEIEGMPRTRFGVMTSIVGAASAALIAAIWVLR
ncbi:YidH family protein [Stakelama marina]|uniref:DUF202 domain-containing protein n=1 Tax=Stakelama marina TaxID=2826939 RepID=A0A8T4IC55_9SPHN|nr:DUF202 domain-containing protein [Stakelama marina]MBR0551682.1 DUF202 domain-containing protein [Stakelama marina]